MTEGDTLDAGTRGDCPAAARSGRSTRSRLSGEAPDSPRGGDQNGLQPEPCQRVMHQDGAGGRKTTSSGKWRRPPILERRSDEVPKADRIPRAPVPVPLTRCPLSVTHLDLLPSRCASKRHSPHQSACRRRNVGMSRTSSSRSSMTSCDPTTFLPFRRKAPRSDAAAAATGIAAAFGA